ncbi:MAG: hypothetical protein WC238_05995 [Parcubacteria group bacterium]|jgi:hypothetical protein
MLRISLIGPGDLDFHFYNLLEIPPEALESEVKKLAKSFVEAEVELELTPSEGIAFELAKSYKKQGGKSVIGSIPKSDKGYGIKHIEPFMNETVNRKPLFNRFIDTGDWRQQNRLKALLGDVVLYLGNSPGADLELNAGIYLFKLMKGFKKGISDAKYLHPEVRAGINIPYTILVYCPFLKSKTLSKETEAYMEKYGISLSYIENPKQLKEKLQELEK